MIEKSLKSALQETDFFNFSHPKIQSFLTKIKRDNTSDLNIALQLYLLVRDGWKYNPYNLSFRPEAWKASKIIDNTEGHCLDKSVLLITFARAFGIPARLHLAKVTNHIGVEKLIEKLGTNVLTPHGYAELYLEDKWVKVTPAFNKELCLLLNVSPLEFDGKNDSVFQEFNNKGNKFMEYLEDYGTFDTLPLDFMINNIKEHYPILVEKNAGIMDLNFSKNN